MASGLTTLAGELKDVKETDKEKTGTIIVLYDCKAAGQSSSRPHISVCPFRQDHHVRSIKGALLGLCGTHDITQLAIPDAAVFIMFDGYKHGTEGSMLRSFSKCDGRMLEKKTKVFSSHRTSRQHRQGRPSSRESPRCSRSNSPTPSRGRF